MVAEYEGVECNVGFGERDESRCNRHDELMIRVCVAKVVVECRCGRRSRE